MLVEKSDYETIYDYLQHMVKFMFGLKQLHSLTITNVIHLELAVFLHFTYFRYLVPMVLSI